MNGKKIMTFAITIAMIGTGFSFIGLNTVMAEDSGRLFEDLNNNYVPIKRIAWHGSGDFALAVTGTDDKVYEYCRANQTWFTHQITLTNSQVCNDIIYDDYWDVFYIGGNGFTAKPILWNFTYGDATAGATGWGPSTGTIMGLTTAHENGASVYDVLVIGTYNLKGAAYWYDALGGTQWTNADSGGILKSGVALNDVTWDTGTTYYAVGEFNSMSGLAYSWASAGAATPTNLTLSWPAVGAPLMTIDWNPNVLYNYGIVGGYDHANGILFKLETTNISIVTMLDNTTGYNIEDFDWSPDGTWGCAVGWQSTEAVLFNIYADNPDPIVKDMGFKIPAGTQPLNGVSVKGYTSPSSALIGGAGGGIGLYSSAADSSTKLQVITDLPHGYAPAMWDMNDTGMTSTLDTQVDVTDETYTFRGEFNYSIGNNDQFFDATNNINVTLSAWYDEGTNELSTHNATPGNNNRTRQFSAWWFEDGSDGMIYPLDAPNEFELHSTGYSVAIPGQRYYIYINITFHKQTYACYGPFSPTQLGNEWDPNVQLDDLNSWNFQFKIYDQVFPTANNYTYGEFGTYKYTNITVGGNPSASAPPGSSNASLSPYSNLTIIANTPYSVNVSIPNLQEISSMATIPATNVSLMHANITGQMNYSNSEIWNKTQISGADVEIGVWGNAGWTSLLPAPLSGTQCNGPIGTNYNNYLGTGEANTLVMWWIDVPAGIPEGQYEAQITFTIGYP